jgi:phosphohistidine phosphatase
MLIYFLRHGDASNDSNIQDSERPLTDIGKKQAMLVGKFLQNIKADINLILTSPLIRACQTGEIVQSIIQAPRIEITENLVNGTDPTILFKQISDQDIGSVILVGHEPLLSDTAVLLIGGDSNTYIPMRKCSLALIETQEPIQRSSGVLKQLTHVDTMAQLLNI